jgi:hypothetical protein
MEVNVLSAADGEFMYSTSLHITLPYTVVSRLVCLALLSVCFVGC